MACHLCRQLLVQCYLYVHAGTWLQLPPSCVDGESLLKGSGQYAEAALAKELDKAKATELDSSLTQSSSVAFALSNSFANAACAY